MPKTLPGHHDPSKRDYKGEYEQYGGSSDQKKRRAGRNRARRKAVKEGKAHKGDGKDVHHKDGNPLNNGGGNTQVMSAAKNRSKSAGDNLKGKKIAGLRKSLKEKK